MVAPYVASMVLTRKLRRSGRGLAVQVPAHLAKAMGWAPGDDLAFDVERAGVLRIRRTEGTDDA